MARSIHDTWGMIDEARRASWTDPEVPRALAAEGRKNLRRQRAIRDSERRLRRGQEAPPPVGADSVPVLVEDEASHVFHPATEEDVRAILSMLAPGSLDGLRGVHLCLDRDEAATERWVREPFTGRLRRQHIPGLYGTNTAGRYNRDEATIYLFGWLCRPGLLGPLALYFKMLTLRTLLHEAAHHFDLAFRTGRSRWDDDDRAKREAWAERAEAEQSEAFVVPYVRVRYPSECEALLRWIEEAGGAAPQLGSLIEGGGTPETAFVNLVRDTLSGHDPDQARVDFARRLHRYGDNDTATAVVQKVLRERPDDPGALAVAASVAACARGDHAGG